MAAPPPLIQSLTGPLDHLRNHEQIATAHRRKCRRGPTDIGVDWNEIEI
jgi:hypothetical protein